MFGLETVIIIGIVTFLIGCWEGNRCKTQDFSPWQSGYAAGFRDGCLLGPPRFVGEKREQGPVSS